MADLTGLVSILRPENAHYHFPTINKFFKDANMAAVIYVSYYHGEGATFDMNYYLTVHMPLVQKHWGPHGLKSWTVVQFEKNDPSGRLILLL